MEHSRKLHPDLIFKSIILFLYSCFFFMLVLNGSIAKYVHPRYNIFIIMSGVLSVLLIIAMLLSVKSHFHGKLSAGHVILFIFPLLFAFFTRNMDANYSDNLSSAGSVLKNTDTDNNVPDEMLPKYILNARENEIVNLVDKYFIPVMDDIYNNPYEYQGKSISLTGIALKRKYAENKEEFAITRMVMICCAADVQPAGFICRYNDAPSIAANAWYKINGTIQIIKIKDSGIPVIMVNEAVKTGKPANQYVYPF